MRECFDSPPPICRSYKNQNRLLMNIDISPVGKTGNLCWIISAYQVCIVFELIKQTLKIDYLPSAYLFANTTSLISAPVQLFLNSCFYLFFYVSTTSVNCVVKASWLFTQLHIRTHSGIIFINLLLFKHFFPLTSELAGTNQYPSVASRTLSIIQFSVSSQYVMRVYCN